MNSELHLFIIWENARIKEKEIIEDIKLNFEIIKIYEVNWKSESFSSNLTRFYGQNLPKNSNKEKHCGRGPFLLIIVKDNTPIYKIRRTSSCSEIVNVNMFDSKEMYRNWTGGGHKIHATNSIKEAEHNLVLLLGVNCHDFLITHNIKFDGEIEQYYSDIIGHDGWSSISQLCYVLNSSINYVLLMDFEKLEKDNIFVDLKPMEILTDNYLNLRYITNSKEVFSRKYSVLNEININNEKVLFNFRWCGDNYFDINWEKAILENKILEKNCYYRPDEENYFYILLYNSLVYESKISKERINKLLLLDSSLGLNEMKEDIFRNTEILFLVLDKMLKTNNYEITDPYDLSTPFNYKYKTNFLSLRRLLRVILA